LGLFFALLVSRAELWAANPIQPRYAVSPLIAGTKDEGKPSPGLETCLTTTLGTDLSAEEPNRSFTFEPLMVSAFRGKRKLEFYAALERPMDAHKNFSLPKATVSLNQGLPPFYGFETGVRLAVSAYDLERWKLDGHKLHIFLGGELSFPLGSRLTLQLLAGPKAQWNAYAQRADGVEQERFGFYERLTALLKLGAFEIEASFRMEQRKTSDWIQEYVSSEEVSYPINETFSVGISHELISGVIDESTGFYRSFRVFHQRESRVSTFVEIQI
jgi:hypothetical protein